MNTSSQSKTKKILKWLLGLAILEAIALIITSQNAYTFENFVNFFLSINVTLLVIKIVLDIYVPTSDKSSSAAGSVAKPKLGGRKFFPYVGLGCIVATYVVWHFFVFPWSINTLLTYDGESSAATVTHYSLTYHQYSPRGGVNKTTTSLSRADSMLLNVSYDGHQSSISVRKSNRSFWLIYTNLQEGNHQIFVRYVRMMPVFVHLF